MELQHYRFSVKNMLSPAAWGKVGLIRTEWANVTEKCTRSDENLPCEWPWPWLWPWPPSSTAEDAWGIKWRKASPSRPPEAKLEYIEELQTIRRYFRSQCRLAHLTHLKALPLRTTSRNFRVVWFRPNLATVKVHKQAPLLRKGQSKGVKTNWLTSFRLS